MDQNRRFIPKNYKYNKEKLKNLKNILHNVNTGLGNLIAALKEFLKIRSRDISPDGQLGGIGYIMGITEIKQILNSAIHNLSMVSDTIADELSNPLWNTDKKEIDELIEQKENIEKELEDISPSDVITSDIIGKKANIVDDKYKKLVKCSLIKEFKENK